MSARDRILGRLRQANVAALPAPAGVDGVSASALNGKALGDLVASLRTNLETMHSEVIEIDAAQLPATLAQVCAGKKIRTLLLPPAALPGVGELPAWPDGPVLTRFDQPIEAHKAALFKDIDAGLTVADCAIADTGMLAKAASPLQPRTLSLVPPIHICLLDRRRLYASLSAALAGEAWAGAMPSNLIFISGPSKTADIQQTLAYGAHGPKELIVIILDLGVAA